MPFSEKNFDENLIYEKEQNSGILRMKVINAISEIPEWDNKNNFEKRLFRINFADQDGVKKLLEEIETFLNQLKSEQQ